MEMVLSISYCSTRGFELELERTSHSFNTITGKSSVFPLVVFFFV